MRANELRIGNLVNYLIEDNLEDPSKWYQETYIDAEDLLILSKKGCDNYQPIPITEEWLLKFHWNGYNYLSINSYFKLDKDGRLYYCNDFTGIILEYVHQLQNLYFALKGEELTYGGNNEQ